MAKKFAGNAVKNEQSWKPEKYKCKTKKCNCVTVKKIKRVARKCFLQRERACSE